MTNNVLATIKMEHVQKMHSILSMKEHNCMKVLLGQGLLTMQTSN